MERQSKISANPILLLPKRAQQLAIRRLAARGHQHLQATGAPFGKAVGVMRVRRAEDLYHSRQDGPAAQCMVPC